MLVDIFTKKHKEALKARCGKKGTKCNYGALGQRLGRNNKGRKTRSNGLSQKSEYQRAEDSRGRGQKGHVMRTEEPRSKKTKNPKTVAETKRVYIR